MIKDLIHIPKLYLICQELYAEELVDELLSIFYGINEDRITARIFHISDNITRRTPYEA
mgnify:CR=1 FL=1